MEYKPTYPSADIERNAGSIVLKKKGEQPRALIVSVEPNSPAYDAGFSPGCFLTSVCGQPLRDVIDWRWLTAGDEIEVGYIDLDGEEGVAQLWRELGEDWGFEFDGLVFDDVRQCRNACTFCFMRQLPRGMRSSLYLRDDDFRLSFLVGTFITCTNLTHADETRIVEQRISPLRVSLQAANPDVRRRLIGKHAQQGIDAIERLLAAGIEFHAQVVLVPGENDGEVLRDTLAWAYERPGILGVGIVPLGYTRHQSTFNHSFNNPRASRDVLETTASFQERAQRERGSAWVFAADEFYRNAWQAELLDHLPSAAFYGNYSMFEDGIGIIRSTVDEWREVEAEGIIGQTALLLRETGHLAYMVAGRAQSDFLDLLIEESGISDVFHPLYVQNDFFGGNVDVTGLLVGADIVSGIRNTYSCTQQSSSPGENAHQSVEPHFLGAVSPGESARILGAVSPGENARITSSPGEDARGESLKDQAVLSNEGASDQNPVVLYLIPRVVFNDDGLTLDDMTLEDMEREAGVRLHMVSCSPKEYFDEIAALASGTE